MPIRVGIYRDEGQWIRLSFPYNKRIIEEIKSSLGRGNYKYSPESKTWYITEPFVEEVARIFVNNGFKDIEVMLEDEDISSAENPYRDIMSTITMDMSKAVYRSLVMILHPDKNPGYEDQFKLLGKAWTERQNQS